MQPTAGPNQQPEMSDFPRRESQRAPKKLRD